MNENSPIWARLIPACTEVRTPLAVRNAPRPTATDLPSTTSATSATTATQCCAMSPGSMSIPTDTKKMAANRSRTGRTRASTSCASPDSATSDPAMKAPSATEYPNSSAR